MYSQKGAWCTGRRSFGGFSASVLGKPTSAQSYAGCRTCSAQDLARREFFRDRLRPQLRELFSNVVRIAVVRINLEDAFQVLLGQCRLCCFGVRQSEVIVIRGAVRLFVLR